VLDASDYVGRPVDDVAGRLTGLGLRVQLRSEVRADVVPDQVTGVEPAGRALAAGDTVVVTYAIAQAGDGAGRDGTVVTGAAVRGGSSTADSPGTPPADGADPTSGGGAAAATTTTLPAQPTQSQSSETTTSSSGTTSSSTETTSTSSSTATSSSAEQLPQ
jgi:serine/threonine-protein kinase